MSLKCRNYGLEPYVLPHWRGKNSQALERTRTVKASRLRMTLKSCLAGNGVVDQHPFFFSFFSRMNQFIWAYLFSGGGHSPWLSSAFLTFSSCLCFGSFFFIVGGSITVGTTSLSFTARRLQRANVFSKTTGFLFSPHVALFRQKKTKKKRVYYEKRNKKKRGDFRCSDSVSLVRHFIAGVVKLLHAVDKKFSQCSAYEC